MPDPVFASTGPLGAAGVVGTTSPAGTTIWNSAVSVSPDPLVTVTAKVYVPASVVFPLISPVDGFSESPGGEGSAREAEDKRGDAGGRVTGGLNDGAVGAVTGNSREGGRGDGRRSDLRAELEV